MQSNQFTVDVGLVALFGSPLAHTVSPQMHHAAAVALGIGLTYLPVEVTPANLAVAVASLRQTKYFGANITLPHKTAMLHLVDAITPLANRIGAVNTVYKSNNTLVGDNTDAPALLRALQHALAFAPSQEHVLLLGAGGAARAALAVLVESNVRSLTLWNRTPERARELLARFSSRSAMRTSLQVVTEERSFALACRGATMIINATSAGLFDTSLPVDFSLLPPTCRIYDMLYGFDGTTFVRDARLSGLTAEDGLWMLVYQAALSFKLWTGQTPDELLMYEAARNALASRANANHGEHVLLRNEPRQ